MRLEGVCGTRADLIFYSRDETVTKKKSPSRPVRKSPSPWMKEPPVGEALRKAYRDVAEEPVPERLQDLIRRLREQENKTR